MLDLCIFSKLGSTCFNLVPTSSQLVPLSSSSGPADDAPGSGDERHPFDIPHDATIPLAIAIVANVLLLGTTPTSHRSRTFKMPHKGLGAVYEGLRWPQDCFRLAPIWLQLRLNMAPTWLSLAQLGSNFAPTWPQLGLTWLNLAVTSLQLGPNLAQLGLNLAQLGSNLAST